MTKKEMLIALQMKIEGMEINSLSDGELGYEVGYGTAVKDIASLMGFNPDEYGYNR